MTDDQQAGTLAFLQSFYTDITLYMPFEAEERAVMAVAPAVAGAPAAAQTPVAGPVPRGPAAAAGPLAMASPAATVPPAATAAPTAPAAPQPRVPPVVAAPGRLPSVAALPPLPAAPPTRPVASPVVPTQPAPPAAQPEVPGYLRTTFDTLGSNPRGVVLLVRLPDAQFQKLPRNVFLNKLLQAINLVMADVVLVNLHGPYPVALENLRREIAATQVLAFGKNLLDVAVRTTQIYEPVRFPDVGLNYLAAAEVEMVEYDVSLKKRLWAGLKAMFL